jgi:hypothetical protein
VGSGWDDPRQGADLVGLGPVLAIAVQKHGAEAGGLGALDVVVGVVANAENLAGFDVQRACDRVEEGWVGFAIPDLGRDDRRFGEMFESGQALEDGSKAGVEVGADAVGHASGLQEAEGGEDVVEDGPGVGLGEVAPKFLEGAGGVGDFGEDIFND